MDIRNNYVIALKGKIDALQEKTETHTPNDNYENFVNTHFETKKKIEINLESYEKHLRLEKNVQTWKLCHFLILMIFIIIFFTKNPINTKTILLASFAKAAWRLFGHPILYWTSIHL